MKQNQLTGISGACDPHCQPLILGWIPAAGQRQRRGEAGAGNCEQQAKREELSERTSHLPTQQQRDPRKAEPDQARFPSADPFRHKTEDQPKERPSEQRDCGEHSLLGCGELERFTDEWPQRSENYSDHETHVEIQER